MNGKIKFIIKFSIKFILRKVGIFYAIKKMIDKNKKNKKLKKYIKDNKDFYPASLLNEKELLNENTTIIHILGGLGNQIAHYAFAKQIQEKHPGTKVVLFNLYNDPNTETERKFELDKLFDLKDFLVISHLTEKREYSFEKLLEFENYLIEYKNTIIKGKFKGTYFFKEILDNTKGYYLKSLFFDKKYHKDLKEKIKIDNLIIEKELTVENKKLLKNIKESNSVSIHVRRGDLMSKAHRFYFDVGLFENNYYKDAINYIYNNIDKPKFFIFSNDILWCKTFFKLKDVCFIDGNIPCVDLYLMSNCKHNILANSTFSYWAGKLNENKNKIVIHPSKYTRTVQLNASEKNWIEIELENKFEKLKNI